jgi:hypothetical protein
MRPSTFGLSFDLTFAYSFLKDCVILLRLVSIGFAKGSYSLIKNIALADVSRYRRRIAGAGVSTSQRPAAECSVVQHGRWIEQLDRGFDFHIAQLPHIKVASSPAVRPAEKHVACSLHQVLAYDYTLPVVSVSALAN